MRNKGSSHTARAAATVMAAALLCSNQAYAQDVPDEVVRNEKDHEGIFTASLENDIFSGTDQHYTNGVRFAFLSAENNIPNWVEQGANALPLISKEGHKRWHFSFGQSIFTPKDISSTNLLVDERPYAGWLYGTVGVISDTGKRLDNAQLTIGVVGPASGAEHTQRFVHNIVDSPDPKGWDNQLENELGVMLTLERKWRGIYEFSPFGWAVDVTPSIGASLGNVYTHAATGAVVRLGYDLPSDYGPPLIRPSLPGSDFFIPQKQFGWYLFAGIEGRAVAHNIFLDGNTFKDSHSVDKNPFVGGLQAGIAFNIEDTRIAYTHMIRTKEFQGQDDSDEFGAITVSVRF
jgi:lipid A 3-O-deacylase